MSRNNRRELEIHSLTLAKYLAHRSTGAECAAALQSIEEGLQPVKQHHNTRQVIQCLAVKVVALKYAWDGLIISKACSMAKPSHDAPNRG